MAQISLTQSFVNAATCPTGQSKQEVTDLSCKGLVLEVRKSGGKTYYLRYTNNRGKQRQYRIGNAVILTLVQARAKCRSALNQFATGEDPCEVKAQTRAIPTFAAFIEEQYLPYVKSYKRSWVSDVSLLKNHLLPRFGGKYLDEITRQDIVKMHYERKASGAAAGSANRLLIMMRFIFNLAVRWELPGIKANPTKGVPLMEENNKIERYVTQEESLALKAALEQSVNPLLKYIIAYLLVTGARKQEALRARWDDIDLNANVWRIPLSKSGKVRHITLSETAVDFLMLVKANNATLLGQRYDSCPYVFPNPSTLKPFCSVFYAWHTARTKAGLPDVRIHDLRHTFASTLVNNGVSLYEVQKLLGHAHIRTTERYAHLRQERLQESASIAGKTFAHILNTPDPIIMPGGMALLK